MGQYMFLVAKRLLGGLEWQKKGVPDIAEWHISEYGKIGSQVLYAGTRTARLGWTGCRESFSKVSAKVFVKVFLLKVFVIILPT